LQRHLVREKVDADFELAKQTAKELKPKVSDFVDDTTSEQDTPAKTTPAKKRSRLNKQQRMASQLARSPTLPPDWRRPNRRLPTMR
jgi:hypothetical protein